MTCEAVIYPFISPSTEGKSSMQIIKAYMIEDEINF